MLEAPRVRLLQRSMHVLKFGGSSVGSPERIRDVIKISLSHRAPVAVVVSAFQGVTDTLIKAATSAAKGGDFPAIVRELEARHLAAVDALLSGTPFHGPTRDGVAGMVNELRDILQGISLVHEASAKTLDHVCSFGERLSARILAEAIRPQRKDVSFLDTRTVIVTDDSFGAGRVDFSKTNKRIQEHFAKHKELQIVTGFIGATEKGETTTLGRGGSDYTAAILGAALNAEEIEIWTDVDGVMTADPRRVEKAFPIPMLTYEEAMELCHFGAKVIYPPTLRPAFDRKIPLRVKNTFRPESAGTLISSTPPTARFSISGISSISNIALLRVQGSGMIGVSGIAQRLFGALAREKINVILITQASSEHSICVAIAPEAVAAARSAVESEFALELRAHEIDPLVIEEQLSVIAVVGENMRNVPGISGKLFQALGRNGINVIAIAQGSSELNISVVTAVTDEAKALNALHDAFFLSGVKTINLFLVGSGMVGSALLQQLGSQLETLRETHRLDLRLTGVAQSKQMAFNARGISFNGYRDELDRAGETMSISRFCEKMFEFNSPNTIFVDCTASEEVAAVYDRILKRAISIVTPNKRANSGPWERYEALKNAAARANSRFFYETTVGAALPVLSTLRDLLVSGDKIVRIEAVLSGTLSFIFNSFTTGRKFSEIVRAAKQRGYTEPDPREDLSGADVGRKLLILAREMGLALEEKNVAVKSLIPESCKNAKNGDEFLDLLGKEDKAFDTLVAEAGSAGKVLRYIGQIENGKASVNLLAVGPDHPFFGLKGTDNVIAFTTARYSEQPLVVKGPGAGTEVTAAGVFADILRVASYL